MGCTPGNKTTVITETPDEDDAYDLQEQYQNAATAVGLTEVSYEVVPVPDDWDPAYANDDADDYFH